MFIGHLCTRTFSVCINGDWNKMVKIPSSFFAGGCTTLCRPSMDLTQLSSQIPCFRELELIAESELLKLSMHRYGTAKQGV